MANDKIQKDKIDFRVTNSTIITPGAHWYPMSEAGAPTDKDYEENFPLKNYSLENSSTNDDASLVLDPAPLSSGKKWVIPPNKTRESDPLENLHFHSVIVCNNGLQNVAVGEWAFHGRNY